MFPEFQVLFRRGGRVAYLNLTGMRQALMVAVTLAALLIVAYIGARFQHFGHVVDSRNGELVQADQDKSALRMEIAALQKSLAATQRLAAAAGAESAKLGQSLAQAQTKLDSMQGERARSLVDAQKRIDALETERNRELAERNEIERRFAASEEKLTGKAMNLAQLTKELDADQQQLRLSDSSQAMLQDRIMTLQKELEKASGKTGQYKTDLANIDRKLEDLAKERSGLIDESETLRSETKRSGAVASSSAASDFSPQPPKVAALASPPPVKPAVASTAGGGLASGAGREIEAVLASTGLDVAKLMADFSSNPRGEGGPYIALKDAPKAAKQADRDKILQTLMQGLPVGRAPLDSYRFESPFGERIDPINHRRSFHSGVDLSAPYRTHVLSTAPGTVIFAGSDGEWGRVVEIDHGHGIVTRYAHLHRTYVVKGQNVSAQFAIGELGSTGRSTGPHVHYEIVVDGTPLDPAKFMGAGQNVVQSQDN
jgi:murein DD-endopeptidase MepM/ murein hydrolase activator NlpD